jgi:hypothetical protein
MVTEARAHAASCPSCARALAAATELEAILGTPVLRAPAGFTDRVLARVRAAGADPAQAPGVRAMRVVPANALAWWVRAAAEPAAAFALGLAALVMWQGKSLWLLGTTGAVRAAEWIVRGAAWSGATPDLSVALPAAFGEPTIQLGLLMGVAPLALLAGRALMRWAERLAAGTVAGPSPRR